MMLERGAHSNWAKKLVSSPRLREGLLPFLGMGADCRWRRARSKKYFRIHYAMMISISHLVDRLSHARRRRRFQWTLQSKSSFHTSCSSENSAAKLKKLLHSTCPCSRIHASCCKYKHYYGENHIIILVSKSFGMAYPPG